VPSSDVNVVVLVPAAAPVVVVLTTRVPVIEGDAVTMLVIELTGVSKLDVKLPELVAKADAVTSEEEAVEMIIVPGSSATPASTQEQERVGKPSELLQLVGRVDTVAGKVVEPDAVEVAYCAAEYPDPELSVDKANPTPASTEMPLGKTFELSVPIIPRRKAPLWKPTEPAEGEGQVEGFVHSGPEPSPVPNPSAVTPETS